MMSNSFLPTILGKSERPFFSNLQKEVDRVFDEFRDMTSWTSSYLPGVSNGKLVPKLDVSETEKEVEITTELPGVKLEDMDISLTENVLTIRGEKSAENKTDEKDYHLVERSYGSFMRSVPLGFNIDQKDVKADFADGVLTIRIKKPLEVTAKTRKIKISKAG
jgi:HSP20 family protein